MALSRDLTGQGELPLISVRQEGHVGAECEEAVSHSEIQLLQKVWEPEGVHAC